MACGEGVHTNTKQVLTTFCEVNDVQIIIARDDCGKEVKCVASQENEDGELIFGDQLEVSKKVKPTQCP